MVIPLITGESKFIKDLIFLFTLDRKKSRLNIYIYYIYVYSIYIYTSFSSSLSLSSQYSFQLLSFPLSYPSPAPPLSPRFLFPRPTAKIRCNADQLTGAVPSLAEIYFLNKTSTAVCRGFSVKDLGEAQSQRGGTGRVNTLFQSLESPVSLI